MSDSIKQLIRKSRLWNRISRGRFESVRIPLRLANWFVHRFIYGKKEMPFSLHFTSVITRHNNIKIGRNVEKYLGNVAGLYIQAINGIEIGDDTMIAPGVRIISANHNLEDFSKHDHQEPIRIGKDCWLGTNCVILPGVQLGDGVIVGAGAIVTKSFPANSVIAGVPAKIIKTQGK